ncbi:hypothetical protein [Halalkalibacter krulwichiae]|uniref:Uncharacterized protein n=1 Tax=Halalkalibacter krulwichiae TaxID=199441 RepID=A0A1X9MI23_9BACI|nr:hypothetical protein [Halalkalibacter krulwichiae]ARK32280.1 hypothetical protein BkAM31D_21815 [Halalkalibacter krulwichiae]
MKIKIAVFGSQEFFNQVKTYEDQVKKIELIPYIYKDPGIRLFLLRT